MTVSSGSSSKTTFEAHNFTFKACSTVRLDAPFCKLYFQDFHWQVIFAIEITKIMATILKQPTVLSFSSTMDDIVIKTTGTKIDLVLQATHGTTTEVLLDETYYPDDDGTITIGQPGDILTPWCRRYGSVDVVAKITEHIGNGKDESDADYSETETDSTVNIGTVLFANADPQVTASWFVENHFLTVLNGEKITAFGRTECLSAYGASTLSVTARVLNTTTDEITSIALTLNPANTTGSIYDYNVSPQKIFDLMAGTNEQQLLSYTCEAGKRHQSYRVITDDVPPAPCFVFQNSFGCWEYIYCTGTHSRSSKYTRSAAIIGGLKRNYNIEEERDFKAQTGWLNEAMADWAGELFLSQSIYLYVGGKMGKEVLINGDEKVEINNEDDNMPSFEFTWNYAQEQHNVMDAERQRIFDATFDYTFN